MKRIVILIISSVLGVLLLAGGVSFSVFMHNYYTLSFDEYKTQVAWTATDEEFRNGFEYEDRIFYPSFDNARQWGYSNALWDSYNEVDGACLNYASLVYKHYNGNADLIFTVENDGKLLTIKFTGTGYPENGEPENLDRTYIFDIEGAGADKLPRLVNRAELIGY